MTKLSGPKLGTENIYCIYSLCGFHLIFYNFNKDGVPSMRKIGDLVITLENEKGEDIEIRTKKIDEARKNLGHWKEPKEIKTQNSFLCQ